MSDLHSQLCLQKEAVACQVLCHALQLWWMSEMAACSLETIKPYIEVRDCIILSETWSILQIPLSVLTKSSLGLPKYMQQVLSVASEASTKDWWNCYGTFRRSLLLQKPDKQLSRSPLTVKEITHTLYTVTYIQISLTFIFFQSKMKLQPVNLYQFLVHRHVRLQASLWWSLAFFQFQSWGSSIGIVECLPNPCLSLAKSC